MCHRTNQISSLLLVVIVVVVECVGLSNATSTHIHALNQQDVLLAITVNQMALLREMNASSTCASRESEFRELQMMKEGTMKQLERMKEETKVELQRMKEEMMGRLQAKEREITEVLEAIRNASFVQPSQQPDLPDLDMLHNDTNPSLCSPYKVLYGRRGSLSPSNPEPYQNSMRCEWRVILPEGTRPVFTWEYLDIEVCASCRCDSLTVSSPSAVGSPRICGYCGDIPPTSHPMYNITDNEFSVVFTSDGSAYRKGFVLNYEAELIP